MKRFILVIIMVASALSATAEGVHPRMLLTSSDMEALKEKVAAGEEIATLMHEEVMAMADETVASDVVLQHKYDESNRRILSWSRKTIYRVTSCAYAYRFTGERKYLDRAIADLQTVCEFPDWNADKHFLDTGEMSMAVAVGYDWLYDELPESLRRLAEEKVMEYGIKPGLRIKSMMKRMNNWNEVCNGGLIAAALGMFDRENPVAAELVTKAVESNRKAIASMYSPDGNYPEGASYWNYGTTYEALLLTVLEDVTGSDFGISQIPGFMRTADYILFMYGSSEQHYCYSDFALVEASSCGLFYFAWKKNDSSYLYNELRILKQNKGQYAAVESRRFLPLLMGYIARMGFATAEAPRQTFFSGKGTTPVVLVHTDWTYSGSDKYLGIKGGSPGAPHGHMDDGSFVFDAYGLRWSMDYPRQNYAPWEVKMAEVGGSLWDSKQDSRRWDIFRYNNYGHSTVTVNGKHFRVDGKAEFIEVYDDDNPGVKMDMTTLYGGDIARYIRTIRFINKDYVEITDELEAPVDKPAEIHWQILSPAKAKAHRNYVRLSQKGKRMKLATESGTPFRYGVWTTDPAEMDYIFSDFEQAVPGTVRCGFESTLKAGEKAKFVTTLKK